MKRFWILLLTLAVLLCAGCHEQVEETQPTETQPIQTEPSTQPTETEPEPTETEPPVPETVEITVKADGVPVLLLTLNRDDKVELVGEFDEEHCIVKVQDQYGLVEKSLLRTADQAPYQAWTGYAFGGAAVYDNLRLRGEAKCTLNMNQTVEVLEDLGFCYLVRFQEELGFMRPGDLSKSYIQYSSGNGGGADGGDIELQAPSIGLLAAIPQEGAVIGEATVLADGTELVLCYLNWGEAVQMVTEEGFAEPREGCVTVCMNDLFAYVPVEFIRQAGEEAFAAWDGYTDYSAALYDNFYLLGDAVSKPAVNTEVRVVEELEDCYLVQLGDVTGYMAKDKVSVNKVYVSTGGDSGGEWSPPVM